ncbi:hypothetical protein P4C99_15220 [Pontiellaceae bacterium B1224]|nr:hypothetical protein [Pontiellaceae bacterium B1224]
MTRAAIIYLSILAAFNVCAERTVTNSVIAHLQGSSWGSKVDTNVVVTAKEQTVFHFHVDCVDGEGFWYDVSIVNDGGMVTLLERDSATSRSGCGSKVETSESLYRFPIERMNVQVVELREGNRITLKNDALHKN